MTMPENRWVEISVQADRGAVDDLVNLLNRHCTGGAVVEELAPPLYGSGGTLIDERPADPLAGGPVTVKGFLPVWDDAARQTLEIALLLLSRASGISEPKVRILEPEDWAESWKAYFPPQHIGGRLVIVPTWVEYAPQPGEIILKLDPGMAFGTGLHASTRLCLLALERHLRPGQRVLDVGTGSGILAIAAALQGAGSVQALDNDPVAVHVAAENAALNGVGARVQVAAGTLIAGDATAAGATPVYSGGGFELLLINILAEIIAQLAPGVAAALAPGGAVIAAGIIAPRAELVVDALTAQGLTITERLEEGEWVALVGRKPLG